MTARGRPRIESEKGSKFTLWILPSTKKVIDEARGNVPMSTAVRIILRHIATTDPRYIAEVLRTSVPS